MRLVHCIDLIACCKQQHRNIVEASHSNRRGEPRRQRSIPPTLTSLVQNGVDRREEELAYNLHTALERYNCVFCCHCQLVVVGLLLWSLFVVCACCCCYFGEWWLCRQLAHEKRKAQCQLVEDELQFDFSVSKSSPCSLRLEAASSISFFGTNSELRT